MCVTAGSASNDSSGELPPLVPFTSGEVLPPTGPATPPNAGACATTPPPRTGRLPVGARRAEPSSSSPPRRECWNSPTLPVSSDGWRVVSDGGLLANGASSSSRPSARLASGVGGRGGGGG